MKKIPAVLLVLLVSCSKNENRQELIPSFSLSESFESQIVLSKIARIDSFKVIQPGIFSDLGEIDYALPFYGGWIVHSSTPRAVSRLNEQGRITHQIKPDFKLLDITSVSVFGQNVFILDRTSRKIHQLNDSLKWERELAIPLFAQSFTMLRDDKIVLYTGNEITEYNSGKLVYFDTKEKKVINDLIPISEKQMRYFNFLTAYHFPNEANEIFFWDSAINEIYAIRNDGILPAYRLDYGKWSLPENFYETANFDNAYDFVQQLRKKDYGFRHFKILVNEEFILINFEKGGDYLTSVFDRTSRKTATFSGLTDDILFLQKLDDIKLSFFVNLYSKNSFIGFVPAELVEKADNRTPSLPDSIKGNGVLLFGSLKNIPVQ